MQYSVRVRNARTHTHTRKTFSSLFLVQFPFHFCIFVHSLYQWFYCELSETANENSTHTHSGQITNFILKSIYRNGILSMHAHKRWAFESLLLMLLFLQFLLLLYSFPWSLPSSPSPSPSPPPGSLHRHRHFSSVQGAHFMIRAIRLHLMDLHELMRHDTTTFS